MVTSTNKTNDTSPHEVFLALKRRIDNKDYAPGAWLPAERSLAVEFGVDRSVVRRAIAQLEERGMISRRTGARPWVSGTGASLSLPRKTVQNVDMPTIVAVMPQHPIYPASQTILHGINTVLRVKRSSCALRVIDTFGATAPAATVHEDEALRSLLGQNVDAVILWHTGADATVPILTELQNEGKSVILLDRRPSGFPSDFVGSDNQAGIDDAVEFLIGLGHRNIGFITTHETTTAALQRLDGYRDAMLAHSLPLRDEWIYRAPDADFSAVRRAVEQFASSAEPVTAVITMNDPLAYFFIEELAARGLKVPDGMSVVGFDDLDRYSARKPVLTTLRQPFENIGKRAAELALMRISEAGKAPLPFQHILLATSLIERSTCRPLKS